MFLLVTGASGVGKTTARVAVQKALGDYIDSVELFNIVPIPSELYPGWRHEAVEQVVHHALKLQADGRPLLFCGDPVPPGEVLAAPSSDQLDGFAALLLDASPEAQRARLAARGDTLELLDRHIAFADWMRAHFRDPQHRPDVIMTDGWDGMQWQRWADWHAGDPRWDFATLDTTHLSHAEVGAAVVRWIRDVLALPA